MPRKLIPLAFILAFGAALVGCEQEGPAEEAGEAVDEAVEEVEDRLDQQGPAERLGEDVDEAVEKAGEEIEEAGDKIREQTDSY